MTDPTCPGPGDECCFQEPDLVLRIREIFAGGLRSCQGGNPELPQISKPAGSTHPHNLGKITGQTPSAAVTVTPGARCVGRRRWRTYLCQQSDGCRSWQRKATGKKRHLYSLPVYQFCLLTFRGSLPNFHLLGSGSVNAMVGRTPLFGVTWRARLFSWVKCSTNQSTK